MDVVENPGPDPMDRRRSRYFAITPGSKKAKPLRSDKVDQLNFVNDENATAGDTIVWFQELTSKGFYSIITSTSKSNRQIDELWDGHASGQIAEGGTLETIVVRKGFAAWCTR